MDPLDILLRLAAAGLGGGLLGIDRQAREKPAGLRTHTLVALGAALVTIVVLDFSTVDGKLNSDAVSRAVQGIVAGIGFLGGGAILKLRDRDDVRGLTTAATIWICAAVGIACGAAQWTAAGAASAFALLVLVVGRRLDRAVARLHAKKPRRDATEPNRPGSSPPGGS